MVVKVKPIEDDISVVSFGNEGVTLEIGKDDQQRAGPPPVKEARSQGPVRRSNRCSRFLATWSSTLPDAVGITGTQHVVNSQDNLFRRYGLHVFTLGSVISLKYYFVREFSSVGHKRLNLQNIEGVCFVDRTKWDFW